MKEGSRSFFWILAVWLILGVIICLWTGGVRQFLVIFALSAANLFFLGKTVASTIGFVSDSRNIRQAVVLVGWALAKVTSLPLLVWMLVQVSREERWMALVFGAATLVVVPVGVGVWVGRRTRHERGEQEGSLEHPNGK